jgi:branched-chain amino acid transport system substrate-binding protein
MAESDQNRGRVGRRDLLKSTGAGAAGVALAGCRQKPETENQASSGDIGQAANTSDADEELPLEGQSITLGVLGPTGIPIGTSMVESAELAVEDLNANGGIAGATVDLEVGNTEAAPGTGREKFIELVKQKNVDATFGTFLTQVTLQIFQPMAQTGTLHVTTAAAGPKPARIVHEQYDKYKYHFRVGPINSFDLAKAELEFLELYADRLGWEKVAPLIENIGPFDPFAELLGENIEDFVEPVATGEGENVRRTSSGTTNWTPIWDKVEGADADLALVAQALTGTASIKQWADSQRPFEFGGINVPDQVYEFWGEVDGVNRYTFTMNAITPQTTNTPQTQPWMERYRETYDTYPVYSGPLTYDGIKVYAKAVENAVADLGVTDLPSSDELVPYLEDVRYTEGIVIDEFQFTPKDADYAHDPQWNSMKESGVPVWQQWRLDPEVKDEYGTMHSFAPEQNRTAEYAFPHWIDYPGDHPANAGSDIAVQPPEDPT